MIVLFYLLLNSDSYEKQAYVSNSENSEPFTNNLHGLSNFFIKWKLVSYKRKRLFRPPKQVLLKKVLSLIFSINWNTNRYFVKRNSIK